MKKSSAKFLPIVLFSLMIILSSCKSDSTSTNNNTPTASGTIILGASSTDNDCVSYDFSTKKSKVLFSNGQDPFILPSGEIVYEEPSANGSAVKIRIVSGDGMIKRTVRDLQTPLTLYTRPKASRDGQYISFSFWRLGGSSPIYGNAATIILKPDGTFVDAIDSLFDASWAPDGSCVLSGSVERSGATEPFLVDGLYKLSSDFTTVTTINNTLDKPLYPAVSPDGKRIAFKTNKHIWIINMDGTGLRQVTKGLKEESRPCWSPDGKSIACSSYGTFEITFDGYLAVIPSDAAAPIDLTNDSPYWPRDSDLNGTISLGRLKTGTNITWK